jgi:hypothetical protein
MGGGYPMSMYVVDWIRDNPVRNYRIVEMAP